MQRSSFLRALSLCLGVLVGCGADDPSMAFPEDDAQVEDGAMVEVDAGEVPSFDVPGMDRGNPTLDVGTDRGGGPVDTGSVSTDRGTVMACPSACSADIDCDPCRTSTDPSTVRYCCLSGLCISMTGVCPGGMMMPPGDGGTDGGADGGLPTDASTGTDAGGGGAG